MLDEDLEYEVRVEDSLDSVIVLGQDFLFLCVWIVLGKILELLRWDLIGKDLEFFLDGLLGFVIVWV